MKITFDWLKDHLKTNLKEKNLLEQLTNIGLEVESVESLSSDNQLFKVAKIIKTEKHPNADRLKVCDVNIGCLLYTSPSPRDRQKSRMPSSA